MRRTGQARPRMFFLLSLFLGFSDNLSFVGRSTGAGDRDAPAQLRAVEDRSWLRKGGCRKSAAVRKGNSKPLPWRFEPHAARYK